MREASNDAVLTGAAVHATSMAYDRALFDEHPDMVWDLDADGTVQRMNARVTAVLGYSPAEAVDHAFAALALPESHAELEQALHAARDGHATVVTCTVRDRRGRAVRLRTALLPIVADGMVRRILASAQDVSAADANAERLAEGSTLYRVLVEQCPECVAILQHDRYVYVNPAGVATALGAGGKAADLLGHDWRESVAPESATTVARVCAAVAAGPPGTKQTLEYRLRRPDGEQIECEGVITHVRLSGEVALHSYSRDTTVRRRIEGERVRTQRMEALGRLAAGVAHDFNNLLGVVLMAVEGAAAAIPTSDPAHDELGDAADAARRGRALTRQLLTFARRQEAHVTTFAINDVVGNMADLLRRIAGPSVELRLALASDAGMVTADPSQVEQALLNLVTNARDALPTGGAVAIETMPGDGAVRLTVRDSGVGLTPEARSHLFEPFYTTKAEGYGLGLATVYGVVTGAGGRVQVESEPGAGTAFHLYFPQA